MFIFELEDLEVIEISCTFASRNKNLTNMPRSTRKKSKTGFYHVMLRVNTEPSPVHLHFQGEYAVRQMEINGNHVERVSLDNPIKEKIVLCDAFLSDLELSETDFITKEEFERVWKSK